MTAAPAPPARAEGDVMPARITLPVLLEMLRGKDADDRAWAAAQLAILPARENPHVLQALLAATRDSSPEVRLAALRSVVAMQAEPSQVYTAAAPMVRDPDGRIRVEAYEDLRRIGVVR
jgi:hypothetical protein